MSGELGDDVTRADLWDEVADERQRLADEREQLADEREQLANERERLADAQERLLDERYAVLESYGVVDGPDGEMAHAEAESRVARAQARLERAVAERDRAQLGLDREALSRARRAADAERGARHGLDASDDGGWSNERRAFVAAERDHLADVREGSQDDRDEFAHRRDQADDERDRAAHRREREIEALESLSGRAATPVRSDLAQVRDEAIRQRRVAARARQRAAGDRDRRRKHASRTTLAPSSLGPLLAAEFVGITQELFASPNLGRTVDRVLHFALDCLPAYEAAGVALSGGALPTLSVATDPVAEQLDAIQIETGQGPAILAMESSDPVHATAFDPWPTFAPSADQLGINGVLAYGLSVPRDGIWHPLGVLTFYSESPVDPDEETRELGSMLAIYLAVAAGLERDRQDLSRREAALHRALDTRDVIGQAKGILMERQRIPAGEAFDILRRTSQRLNLRLNQIAAELAETGELPA